MKVDLEVADIESFDRTWAVLEKQCLSAGVLLTERFRFRHYPSGYAVGPELPLIEHLTSPDPFNGNAGKKLNRDKLVELLNRYSVIDVIAWLGRVYWFRVVEVDNKSLRCSADGYDGLLPGEVVLDSTKVISREVYDLMDGATNRKR